MRKPRSLTALRAFEAVARLGGISAAAQELNVTRPAVSKQVALLEQDLGTALLERSGNAIRLTKAGAELHAGLRQAFDLISTAVDAATRPIGPEQRLRLLVCRDFAASWLAERVGDFLAANPGISVEITAEQNGGLRLDEEFDFRIFYGMPGEHPCGSLEETELCRWIDLPVCTAAFSARYLGPGQRVCEAPYLVDGNYDVWEEWCAHTGFEPGGPLCRRTVFNETTLCSSVAISGGGLTIGDSLLTLAPISSGELVVPFPYGLLSSQSYLLFCKPRQHLRPSALRFSNWLRKALDSYQPAAMAELARKGVRVVDRKPQSLARST